MEEYTDKEKARIRWELTRARLDEIQKKYDAKREEKRREQTRILTEAIEGGVSLDTLIRIAEETKD